MVGGGCRVSQGRMFKTPHKPLGPVFADRLPKQLIREWPTIRTVSSARTIPEVEQFGSLQVGQRRWVYK